MVLETKTNLDLPVWADRTVAKDSGMTIVYFYWQMEIMADSKMKAEIQALTFLSSDYLSRVYLPNKLKFGGWI